MKLSRARLLIIVFWCALTFAFVMALLPKPPQVPGAPSDKVQHMLAFAVLASLASHAYVRVPLLKVGVALAGFGALIEILQAIPALHRDASLWDWIADCAATAVVLTVTHLKERG